MQLTVAQTSYEPFTSTDLETTGLDPVLDNILEIGCAFYDGKHIEPKETMSCIVIPNGAMVQGKDFRMCGQVIALVMNAALLSEVVEAFKKRDKDKTTGPLKTASGQLILEEDDARDYLYQWLDFVNTTYSLEKKHILAGKNLGALDVPFLKELLGEKKYDSVISYRTLDLTSMFAPFVRQTKSLSYINKLRGLPEVSHRALGDAVQTGDAIIDIYQMNLQFPTTGNH